MFPKAQFHFSLVMLMGNDMENGNTGGEYSFMGEQPSLVEVYQSGFFVRLVSSTSETDNSTRFHNLSSGFWFAWLRKLR